MDIRIGLVAAAVMVLAPASLRDDILPAPTGPYAVGRRAYHLVDSTRRDPLAPGGAGAKREIALFVWYPAAASAGPPAPYLPDFDLLEQAVGTKNMKDALGAAYETAKSGRLMSHSLANVKPKASRVPYPTLIFSHGFGETGLTYAAMLEDLASHGYVGFGIEHPHDAFAVELTGKRVAVFPQTAWDSALAAGGAATFQLAQILRGPPTSASCWIC